MKNANDSIDWPGILIHLAESDIDYLVVGGAALVLHREHEEFSSTDFPLAALATRRHFKQKTF